ncbi:MAG: ABC transporter permease, partial [Candidatus Magasanikbacteria bacterium]|nr:ABC transporter permease [Candidatus Magasanikbacteria bacterium]
MITLFKRIIKAGWKSFSRNIGLSIATIFVMIMVIFLITFLFLYNIVSKILISDIQEKVDISIYFKKDVLTEKIFEIKSDLAKLPDVKNIEYISKEQALDKFTERYKNNPTMMESLKELGENPFLPSLNIKAREASQYEQIAKSLETSSFKDLIEKVDYYQRKPVIDKIFSVTSGINRGGIFFSIIFGLIAVLAAFNTIKIAIQNLSEEISTMRLVGASNWFIEWPFLIQGIIIGIFATIITLLITLGICYGIDSKIKLIAPA